MTKTERIKNLSPGEYFLRRSETDTRTMTFNATTTDELASWKQDFSASLHDCLGPFPDPCALDPETIEIVDETTHWREKVLFNSERDMAVSAYVLVPKNISNGEHRPAILACHGHGHGKDDLVGMDHGEKKRVETIRNLNYDYARQFVKQGYVVIAPDWRGFGERKIGGDVPPKDICNVLEIKALLLGMNMLTLNIWDAKCSLDYLQQRPEVDPERIACAGLSYGGTMTLFTTAMDERIRCAVVSGYLNKLRTFAIGMANFCGAQIPTGLLKYGDLSDVACLISPRPLLIESGIHDTTFPIGASREAAMEVRKCYQTAGVPDHFDVDEFDGGHRWNGAKAYEWITRWI